MALEILVIRLRELGDTLLTTPLLRQLRRLYPQARIGVLCQAGNVCVMEHNRHVDEIIMLPRQASAGEFLGIAARLRQRHYELVVDVQSLPKTALMARLTGGQQRLGYRKPGWRNRLCYTHPFCEPVGEYSARQHLGLLQDARVDLDDIGLDFPISDEAASAADAFCRTYLRPPVAAVFGVSRFGHRMWPVKKMAAVADRLARLGMQPWLVYGPGQAEAAHQIASLMKYPCLVDYEMPSFATLRGIFSQCALFFGNDGGPKHVAVAAGIPTVTVSETDHARVWSPPGTPRHRVACTRTKPGVSTLAGAFTHTDKIAEIPVDAAWKEIVVALRQPAQQGSLRHSPRLRAA